MLAIKFIDGLLFSLLSIALVLSIIGLIILLILPLKAIKTQQPIPQPITPKQTKHLSEDMIVAVLIASIDFRESEKKEPKLRSIKEMKS